MPKRLQSASEHYARQQRITATGVAAARRARETGDVGRMASIVALFQAMAARDAADAVPDMLEEQGITPASVLRVVVQALVGIASDGRPLESLMSLIETEQQLDMIVSTQIQDAARVSGGRPPARSAAASRTSAKSSATVRRAPAKGAAGKSRRK